MKKFLCFVSVTMFSMVYLIYVLPAHAIPCSAHPGITGSIACLDGAPEDDTLGQGDDKAFDLNAGSYFGFNDWNFLQLQGPTSDETVVDVGLNLELFTNAVGSWSIFESAWDDFDNLVIILKSDTTGEDEIYWSSYLLADGAASGIWVSGRPLSSMSIFGRGPVGIAEPATWGIVLAGLIALVWTEKIRHRRIFSDSAAI